MGKHINMYGCDRFTSDCSR